LIALRRYHNAEASEEFKKGFLGNNRRPNAPVAATIKNPGRPRRLFRGPLRIRALLQFIGGCGRDHNTAERARGFRAAHADIGVPDRREPYPYLRCAPEKAETSLEALARAEGELPSCHEPLRLDPFAALLWDEIEMVRQDVQGMLTAVFEDIDHGAKGDSLIEIQPMFVDRDDALVSNPTA
jgi:LacI family fructose operon transcriptional repressor